LPWYNCTGWLGVKQFTYFFFKSVFRYSLYCVSVYPFPTPHSLPKLSLCCCYSQTLHTTAREYILAEAFFSFKQASTFEKKSWKLCYNFTFMTICSLALLSTVFSFWNEDFTHDHIEFHTFDTRTVCTNVYEIHIATSWACLFDSRTFMWKREKSKKWQIFSH